ncbi:hypothetical protein R9C00_28410 [Flammeovirgaceae bacterium SG7u.111]|nr:hypothetical protein [Flammeovirgaceae bacterium SG7u.132]WPO35625.1 hypothetical protein R9C00_28410 [Flammeovirgaceae bacterium SG7u.111]
MRYLKLIPYFLVIALLASCGPKVPTTTGPFNDDLSMYRIKVAPKPIEPEETVVEEDTVVTERAVLPENTINKDLDYKLELIARKNQEIKTTQGYKVMVYSGKGRKEGSDIERSLVVDYGRNNVKFRYDPPNFIVLVGNFVSKLDAHRLYVELQKKYPMAVVISDKIEIDLQQYISKD